ncbi:hypothetical protein Ddye_019037 [Dipteronia dyeriana]|uniref:Uncharacterized protein n=1 Tax=Dipteronia dyeriana TaxID=168575 RepID=A0AAD9TXJ7_9ROSI|nr:hypothetical protein Ddye_019037 [Dipteronia dyeriana]
MIPSNQLLKLHGSFNSSIFSNYIYKILSWKHYYNIFSCKVALFASGLVFSRKLVDLAVVATLTTYFTDDSSKYPVGKAAVFGNVREGLSASVEILLTYFSVDAHFGHRKIIIHSTVYYINGMVVMCLVSAKLFSRSMILIDIFNIMGVILLAVGKAGVEFSLGPFIAHQFRSHKPQPIVNEDRVMARTKVWWGVAWILSVVSSITLIGSWTLTFIITSSVMGMALILFLCGIRFYHQSEEYEDDVEYHRPFCVLRVVKASLLKMNKEYPSSSDKFFHNHENQLELQPQLKFLRWLDKAAIIESTCDQNEQEKLGRLCTVTQVEESKFFFKMVPMWIAFFGFGLLLSTGDAFFSEQGNNMYGSLLPVLILQHICKQVCYLYDFLLRKWVPEAIWKQAKIVRFWAGMVFSTFCFAIAWRVEVHRLQIVELDETIPMSIFWLAPQFCLLGLMRGLIQEGLEEFMTDQLPDSWKNFVPAMNGFVIDGIGSFLSIVCIYGNRSLFANPLNSSGLDKYYQKLTILGFVNLCYYWFISTLYTRSSNTHARKVCDESQSTIATVV